MVANSSYDRQGPMDAMGARIVNSTISRNSSTATAGAILTSYIRPEEIKVLYPDRPLTGAVAHNQVAARVVDLELPGDRGDRAGTIAGEEHRHEAVVPERAHDLPRARPQRVAQREHGERAVLAAQYRDGRRRRRLLDEGLRLRRQRTGDPGHERRPAEAHPAALRCAGRYGVFPLARCQVQVDEQGRVQELQALTARRRQLIEMLVMERNRLRSAHLRVRRDLRDSIRSLERRLARTDDDIGRTLRDCGVWREKVELLESVSGVAQWFAWDEELAGTPPAAAEPDR